MYILARILAFIILLVIAVMVAIQSPRVQTLAVKEVTSRLSEEIDADIRIGSLRMMPFNALVIKDILILDKDPYVDLSVCEPIDTVFKAGSVSVTFSLKGLLNHKGFHMGKVSVKDGSFHLSSEPGSPYKSNLQRIFRLQKKDSKPDGDLFDINKAAIDGIRFRLTSYKPSKAKHHEVGVNFHDIDATAFIKASGIYFRDGKMGGKVDKAAISEKGGLNVHELTGSAVAGGGRVVTSNLHILDDLSDIRLKSFSMTFTDDPPFADFVDKVILEGEFLPSKVDVRTITYGCGALEGNDLSFNIRSGHVKGAVNRLNFENLSFNEAKSGVSGSVGGVIVDCTDIINSTLVAHVRNVTLNSDGLTAFLNRWARKGNLNLGRLAHGESLRFNGDVKGRLNSMEARGRITSAIGSADADLRFRHLLEPSVPIDMQGSIDASGLDLGKVLGNKSLGECTMHSKFKSVLGGNNGIAADIDTLEINSINLLNYTYKDIYGSLSYGGGVVDGIIRCADPNLCFSLDTRMHIGGPGIAGPGRLTLDIPYADLEKLAFYDTQGTAKVECGIDLNIDGTLSGDGETSLFIRDLKMEDKEGWKNLSDIAAGATNRGSRQNIVLYSNVADIQFKGDRQITEMLRYLKGSVLGKQLPALFPNVSDETPAANYSLLVNLSNARSILQLFAPEIYIADNTSMSLMMTEDGKMQAYISSPRLAMGKNYMKNVGIGFDNNKNAINCSLISDDIRLSGVGIKNGLATVVMSGNVIDLDLHYDGTRSVGNNGNLMVDCELSRDESDSLIVKLNPSSSFLTLGNHTWTIGQSEVLLRGSDITVPSFSIGYDDDHCISIAGGISKNRADTLSLGIRNLELGISNDLIENNYQITGDLKGNATLYSPLGDKFGLEMEMVCDSLSVGDSDMSRLTAYSKWNPQTEALDFELAEISSSHKPLDIAGNYNPEGKLLKAKADFNGFDLKQSGPFLQSVLSDIDGSLTGAVNVWGPTDLLSVSSDGLKLDDARIRVAFTNVGYILNGGLRLDDKALYIDDIRINDEGTGYGNLRGDIRHHNLKDFRTNLRLTARDLKAIDIPENSSKTLYGNLAVSGRASLSGPMDDIQVSADVSTSGDGNVHIPLPSTLSASTSNLLTFKEPEVILDPYDEMMATIGKTEKKGGKLTTHAKIKVTPSVIANVEIDKENGHVLTANGNGDVTVDLKPSKNLFNLDGDFEIEGGSYHFSLPGIVSRDFSIQQGSALKFGGDVMNTSMDITATHNVKTTLSTLLADTTAVSSRRNVICGIGISNKISKPEVSFSIDVPDLDPTTKAQVEAALNTEDKVQKQFMSLLLLGTFLPSEQSGVVNGTNMVFSNVSEIMSSQVNNILNKLNIPVDLGFGYQQNTRGTDIFDVAISTQLFNNRVEVSGTVGNRKYGSSSASKGEMVGDLDIEIKIDKQGQLRGKLFSHSADEHSSYLDYSQRNGGGIAFQKEFNTLSELFKSLFSSRKATARQNDAPSAPPPGTPAAKPRDGEMPRPAEGMRGSRNSVHTIKIE